MQPLIQDSKKCLTTATLLVKPRTGPNESFVISTDASNKETGTVLLQKHPDGSFRPILLLC